MKVIYFFSLFFIINVTLAQTDLINTKNYFFEYDITYNNSFTVKKNGVLIVDNQNSKSFFYIKKDTLIKNKKYRNGKIALTIKTKNTAFNFLNYNKDSLVSKENVATKEFNVTEKIPHFKWKLIETAKLINNIEVKCATTNFRGRNYIAWYSTKYPVKSGPWKFNGLPGLIVNIYDETRKYEWFLSKIYTKKINFNTHTTNIINKELPFVSLKKLIDLRQNDNEYDNSLYLKLKSKMPRGSKISITKAKRNGLELKYEWEKTTIKE